MHLVLCCCIDGAVMVRLYTLVGLVLVCVTVTIFSVRYADFSPVLVYCVSLAFFLTASMSLSV